MFISTNRELADTIRKALDERNYEKLHRTVHQCKGSAGFIGAERVHDVSLNLQTAARELQQQQTAAGADLDAPIGVRAQVHALVALLSQLFDELERMKLTV